MTRFASVLALLVLPALAWGQRAAVRSLGVTAAAVGVP